MGSPDVETMPNTLVLVGHGISSDLHQMEQMKISERCPYFSENPLLTQSPYRDPPQHIGH